MSPRRVRATRGLATTIVLASAAACPAAAGAAALGSRTLHAGSRGHDVRVLQDWLSHLRLRTPVDGIYGRRTRRSVRRFERRRDLHVDGRLSPSDARVLRALVEGGASAAPAPVAPTGPVALAPDGRTAVAPGDAPPQVAAAVAAANRLTDKPYVWGGGHGDWEDDGYDCSGAVSYALHAAGLLDVPMDSSELETWGASGPGAWITVYTNPDHAYVVIGGLRFDTSGEGEDGPRWRPDPRAGDGYEVRHPEGL